MPLLILRYWRYIAGALAVIAVLVALIAWGNKREAQGVAKERAAWVKLEAAAAAKATALAAERDAAVRSADVAGALARQSVEALAVRGRDTVKEYYRANPASDVACLSDGRLQSIADSDRAAIAAAGAASVGAGAVRDPGD